MWPHNYLQSCILSSTSCVYHCVSAVCLVSCFHDVFANWLNLQAGNCGVSVVSYSPFVPSSFNWSSSSLGVPLTLLSWFGLRTTHLCGIHVALQLVVLLCPVNWKKREGRYVVDSSLSFFLPVFPFSPVSFFLVSPRFPTPISFQVFSLSFYPSFLFVLSLRLSFKNDGCLASILLWFMQFTSMRTIAHLTHHLVYPCIHKHTHIQTIFILHMDTYEHEHLWMWLDETFMKICRGKPVDNCTSLTAITAAGALNSFSKANDMASCSMIHHTVCYCQNNHDRLL